MPQRRIWSAISEFLTHFADTSAREQTYKQKQCELKSTPMQNNLAPIPELFVSYDSAQKMKLEAVYEMVEAGEITDSLTVAAIYKLMLLKYRGEL